MPDMRTGVEFSTTTTYSVEKLHYRVEHHWRALMANYQRTVEALRNQSHLEAEVHTANLAASATRLNFWTRELRSELRQQGTT